MSSNPQSQIRNPQSNGTRICGQVADIVFARFAVAVCKYCRNRLSFFGTFIATYFDNETKVSTEGPGREKGQGKERTGEGEEVVQKWAASIFYWPLSGN